MTTTSASIKAFLFVFLILLFILVNFFAQTPQPSPATTPEASPSPSPSPSPTPARAPSPTPLPGAQNFHQWGSVTVFNGLPSDSVRAIAQTPDGVMWFGTDNGLARFDGRRVQNFLPGDAETNRILALKSSASGDLWIGTNTGAFVYSNDRFRPVRGSESFGVTAISTGSVTSLGTDAGLVLRVTGDEGDLLSAAAMFPEPIRLSDGSPLSITSLLEHDGKLLVSTSGLGVFAVEDGRVTEHPSSPRPLFVNSLAAAETGELWIGSDAARALSGIYLTGASPRTVRVPAPTADVLSLEVTDSGLWAGTERFGLFHIVESKVKKNYTFENTSGGLRSNTVFTLFTDREGVIWIGTNRGVSRFDRLGAVQQTVSDIPNSNFIRTLFRAEDGTLYAGSNRGLFAFDRAKDTWNEVPAFRNKVIYAIRKRSGSSILVGTPDGLFDMSGGKILEGDVRSLAVYNRRDYAAVFGRGVVEVTGDRSRVVVPDTTVTSIAEGKDKLWIGTLDRGLFSWDGSTVGSEAGRDVLNSGTIWGMSQSDAGELIYIAGQHGVFAFREGDGVEQIVAAEDVRDVVERDGHIWAASTTRGLLHARRDDRFGWLVSSIAFEQGLPSEKAFSIRPADDSLIVATNRGVVTYEAGRVAPKLIVTRVLSQRAHDLAELRSTIALEYPQNSLLVEVAGQSSRTFPEEFQYAFVLKDAKGAEVDRRLSNDSQYAPADLAPGDYTIESIAFNRDLLASDPVVISFSIARAPFPWTATALAVLLLMALVALVWAFIEHRRIKQRNRELAAARLDLANEAERERRRIARDLHDQTLADLRSLMMTTDKLPDAGATVREEIESISTDIRRICEDLSPSVLENVGLVAALEFLLDRTVQSKSFVSDDSVEREIDFPLHVQLQIYRIAQEVLTNIARHSDADSVEMRVEMREGDLVLTVRDNGTTFQPDGTPNGRGISNIRARANLINGRVAWKESKEGGNVFSLRI
jgi:signal transduction histidine kinase